jgi:ribosomal protein S18 acetylase RimI-like enzyme
MRYLRIAFSARARATERGYQKLVIWVRASNEAAPRYYIGLNFCDCAYLSRQLLIGNEYDDEVPMELFL